MNADWVRKFLHYAPLTGVLTWQVSPRARVKVGDVAGFVHKKNGRRIVRLQGKNYKASRVIWLWMTGEWPKGVMDHRNRISHDDRWENLRDTTLTVNARNVSKRKSSMAKGVYWNKRDQRWTACIGVAGKLKALGNFVSFEEAVAARKQAEISLWGKEV